MKFTEYDLFGNQLGVKIEGAGIVVCCFNCSALVLSKELHTRFHNRLYEDVEH